MKHNGFSIPYIKFLSTKSAEDSFLMTKLYEKCFVKNLKIVFWHFNFDHEVTIESIIEEYFSSDGKLLFGHKFNYSSYMF